MGPHSIKHLSRAMLRPQTRRNESPLSSQINKIRSFPSQNSNRLINLRKDLPDNLCFPPLIFHPYDLGHNSHAAYNLPGHYRTFPNLLQRPHHRRLDSIRIHHQFGLHDGYGDHSQHRLLLKRRPSDEPQKNSKKLLEILVLVRFNR